MNRAIVLTGGRGTRLRPLTQHIPKHVLPVAGEPLVVRIVRCIIHCSAFDCIDVVTGWKGDVVRSVIEDARLHDRVTFVQDPVMAGYIRFLIFHLRNADPAECCLFWVGDTLAENVQASLLLEIARSQADSLATAAYPSPAAGHVRGQFTRSNGSGRVTAYTEHVVSEGDLVNVGIYAFASSSVGSWRNLAKERDLFPVLIDEGRLFAVEHSGFAININTHHDYVLANRVLSAGWRNSSSREPSDSSISRSDEPRSIQGRRHASGYARPDLGATSGTTHHESR